MPRVHHTTLPTGAKFSARRAQRVIRFIERVCVHTKSDWSGTPFKLSSWQRGSAEKRPDGTWSVDGVITPLFGAVRWDDMFQRYVRQFRELFMETGRKSGKSELMAALGLYFLIADREPSAEVYGAASDRDQASKVFDVARDMCRLSPILRRMIDRAEVVIVDSRKEIHHVPSRSVYKVVSADAMGELGGNPHAIVFDELLTQKDRTLWDYLWQGKGTRPQPMMLAVTTPGPDRESFAYAEHEWSLKVAANPDLDPKRFAYVCFVSADQNWEDESVWGDANPGLGEYLNISDLRDEYLAAKNKGDLSEIENFKIFRLAMWGIPRARWLDMQVWDESEDTAGPFSDEDLQDVWAVGGLDLADTTDIVAWVLVFRTAERTMVLPRFWVTRKAMETRHRRRLDTFKRWEAEGHITVVDADSHDYLAITEQILADIERYKVDRIGYDQFQAPAVVNAIQQKSDVVCIKVPQTTTRMDAGARELVRLMGLRQLTTNKNPIMRWMAENAIYKMDSERKIKPDKVNSKESIDGITALVDALVALVIEPEEPETEMFAFSDEELYGEGGEWI